MKKWLAFLMCVLVLFSFGASADEPVHIAALKGPTAMGMAKMMTEENPDYAFTLAASADMITPNLIQGKLDIACVPANLAAVLHAKTSGGVQVLAVNTLGVLYLVERGDTVHSLTDLKGRTVYSSGKGASPEYVLNYLLAANGMEAGRDVQVEYKAEHAECLSALLADQNAVALLPQPFVTTARRKAGDIRIAVDLNDEWAQVNPDGSLLTGVVIVRTSYARENGEKVSAFLNDYAESVAFINGNPEEGAKMIGTCDIVPEDVAIEALPYCGIVCVTGDEMREMLDSYLTVLYQADPASVGGKMPGDGFCWNQ